MSEAPVQSESMAKDRASFAALTPETLRKLTSLIVMFIGGVISLTSMNDRGYEGTLSVGTQVGRNELGCSLKCARI